MPIVDGGGRQEERCGVVRLCSAMFGIVRSGSEFRVPELSDDCDTFFIAL